MDSVAKVEFIRDFGFIDLHDCATMILTHVVTNVDVESTEEGSDLFDLVWGLVLNRNREGGNTMCNLIYKLSNELGMKFIRPAFRSTLSYFQSSSPYNFGVLFHLETDHFFSTVVYRDVQFPVVNKMEVDEICARVGAMSTHWLNCMGLTACGSQFPEPMLTKQT